MTKLHLSRAVDEAGAFALLSGPDASVPAPAETREDVAGAIADAVRVFEDGLAHLRKLGAPGVNREEAETDVTGLLAAIAGQTSLMALRASLETARRGEAGGGFTAAAGEVRDLAGQMARATDTLVSQVGQIQALAERRASALGGPAQPASASL